MEVVKSSGNVFADLGFDAEEAAYLQQQLREMIGKIKALLLTYPVTLTSDETDGGFVVTFPDLPEAITQGDTVEQCLANAVDCLDETIAARIDDGEAIPQPSVVKGSHKVSCLTHTAIKAALYLDNGINI